MMWKLAGLIQTGLGVLCLWLATKGVFFGKITFATRRAEIIALINENTTAFFSILFVYIIGGALLIYTGIATIRVAIGLKGKL